MLMMKSDRRQSVKINIDTQKQNMNGKKIMFSEQCSIGKITGLFTLSKVKTVNFYSNAIDLNG